MTLATDFQLDERLANDCELVMDFELCRLLMMRDSQYPWFILVPRRANVQEIYQLDEADLALLYQESTRLGEGLMQLFAGHKLNVAALGNVVSQLHMHHVVRYTQDAAWPDPIWGKHPAQPYTKDALDQRVALVRGYFGAESIVGKLS